MNNPVNPNSTVTLQTLAQRKRATALAEYIREAREDIKVLDIRWEDAVWKKFGTFSNLEASQNKLGKNITPENLLAPTFIDFAKAYILERFQDNPSSNSGHSARLRALRLVEAALRELRDTADPLKIDLAVLDRAAALANKQFKPSTAYGTGLDVMEMVQAMAAHGILPLEVKQWTSPIVKVRDIGVSVGSEGDRARQNKLPNAEALEVLAAIFNRDLHPSDERLHRDICTTTATALLISAPSRGQEIFKLPVNLLFKETDRFGDQQLGLLLDASKGFGAYIKWVFNGMGPVVQKGIARVKAMTENARALARHLEDEKTNQLFFRHANCPDVGENEPLTTVQACQALGRGTDLTTRNASSSLHAVHLCGKNHAHTLHSLWTGYVLPKHKEVHPYFPYVSQKDKAKGKKGGLKFSEALFCMLANQLHATNATNPLLLWVPTLTNAYGVDLRPSETGQITIFNRYKYLGRDGKPLGLKSHQIRHMLNTEAQRMGLSDEMIAHWSGRKDIHQNKTYDGRWEQERVDQARPLVESRALRSVSPSSTEVGKTLVTKDGYWRIDKGPKPRSCADLADIQPQLAGLMTAHGECYHDWALAQCDGFITCLECSEHGCIKGSDDNAQVRLQRIESLLRHVMVEVAKAQAAVTSENWGAQEWLETQKRYAAKLEQLIAILQNPDVPDYSVIRLTTAQHPSHLQRVMRGIAVKALEDGTEPEHVMKHMLNAIKNAEQGVQPIVVHLPKRLQDLNIANNAGK
jgi:hypothetical protein